MGIFKVTKITVDKSVTAKSPSAIFTVGSWVRTVPVFRSTGPDLAVAGQQTAEAQAMASQAEAQRPAMLFAPAR